MRKHIVLAIIKKDIKSTFSSKKVWMPMMVMSLLLGIILPTTFTYLGTFTTSFNQSSGDITMMTERFITKLPKGDIQKMLVSLSSIGQQFIYFFLNFALIPMFLMISVINSMVTASNSFAGEKERKTFEHLLFAPISIKELFVAKILSSFIPTMCITYLLFIVDAIILNSMVHHVFHTFFLINPTWLILILWLIPMLVLFTVLLNVFISAKVKTFQEAQQFGGLLVLPIIGLIVGQTTGLFFLSPFILFIIGIGVLLGNVLLLKIMTKMNNRYSLFQNQIH